MHGAANDSHNAISANNYWESRSLTGHDGGNIKGRSISGVSALYFVISSNFKHCLHGLLFHTAPEAMAALQNALCVAECAHMTSPSPPSTSSQLPRYYITYMAAIQSSDIAIAPISLVICPRRTPDLPHPRMNPEIKLHCHRIRDSSRRLARRCSAAASGQRSKSVRDPSPTPALCKTRPSKAGLLLQWLCHKEMPITPS